MSVDNGRYLLTISLTAPLNFGYTINE